MEQRQIWNKSGFRQMDLLDSFIGSSEEDDLGGGSRNLGDDLEE